MHVKCLEWSLAHSSHYVLAALSVLNCQGSFSQDSLSAASLLASLIRL